LDVVDDANEWLFLGDVAEPSEDRRAEENRDGGSPVSMPNAVASAPACGGGSRSSRSTNGRQS
jgi:hypothetical protein